MQPTEGQVEDVIAHGGLLLFLFVFFGEKSHLLLLFVVLLATVVEHALGLLFDLPRFLSAAGVESLLEVVGAELVHVEDLWEGHVLQ